MKLIIAMIAALGAVLFFGGMIDGQRATDGEARMGAAFIQFCGIGVFVIDAIVFVGWSLLR